VVTRKAETALVQTGLRLEPAVLDRLREGGLSASKALRDRLDRTFREDDLDPATRELRDAVTNLAELVHRDFGDWHSSPRAHAVFAAMIVERLAAYAPKVGDAAEDLGLGIGDAPETIKAIAMMRERDDRRAHAYPQLEARTAGPSRIAAAMRRNRTKKEGDHD
jgi:hypothetical protein